MESEWTKLLSLILIAALALSRQPHVSCTSSLLSKWKLLVKREKLSMPNYSLFFHATIHHRTSSSLHLRLPWLPVSFRHLLVSSVDKLFPAACRIVWHCLQHWIIWSLQSHPRLYKAEKNIQFKVIQDNIKFNVKWENSWRELMELWPTRQRGQTTVTQTLEGKRGWTLAVNQRKYPQQSKYWGLFQRQKSSGLWRVWPLDLWPLRMVSNTSVSQQWNNPTFSPSCTDWFCRDQRLSTLRNQMSCLSTDVSAVEIVHQAAPLFGTLICSLPACVCLSPLNACHQLQRKWQDAGKTREINNVYFHRVPPPFRSPHLCLRTLAVPHFH